MRPCPAHPQTRVLLGVEHMSIRVEIYTAGGIAVGVLPRASHLRDALEAGESLRVEAVTWHPLDDTAAGEQAEVVLAPDDIHLATVEESEDLPVHAQWHDIVLDVGPYRVLGQLATMPGFDPGPRPGPADGRVRPAPRRERRAPRRGRRRPVATDGPREPLRRRPGRGGPDARLLLPGCGDDLDEDRGADLHHLDALVLDVDRAGDAGRHDDGRDRDRHDDAPSGDAGEPAADETVAAPTPSAEVAAAAPATEGA